MKYKLEKETENGFIFVKELIGIDYDELKEELSKSLGKCAVTSTDVESEILWVKPYSNKDVYRVICLGEV